MLADSTARPHTDHATGPAGPQLQVAVTWWVPPSWLETVWCAQGEQAWPPESDPRWRWEFTEEWGLSTLQSCPRGLGVQMENASELRVGVHVLGPVSQVSVTMWLCVTLCDSI